MQIAYRQCGRRFRNNRRVINYLWFCNPAPIDDEVGRPPPLAPVNKVDNYLNGADDAVAEQHFIWANTPGDQAIEELKEFYEKNVFWRKKSCLKDQVEQDGYCNRSHKSLQKVKTT